MVNKPKASNKLQDTADGYTEANSNERGDQNSQNMGPKPEYQRTSPGEDTDNILITEQTFRERLCSWRTLIVVILHLSFVHNMMPVVTMSMSLVCMCGPVKGATNATQNKSRLPMITTYSEFTPVENTTQFQEQKYEFDWDSETRGLLISGYLFTVFLAPQISNVVRGYLGNKLTLTLFSVFFAFLSFVSPIAARTNVYLFLAIRILSGLCININLPISVDTLAWWSPAKEKLTSSTVVMSGWVVGTSVGTLVAGYFCKTGIDNGWPLQFYFHGILVVVWTIAWHSLTSRKPENHPYISEQEKAYILTCRVGMNQTNIKGGDATPYRTILTSRPVLAFIASSVLQLWSMIIFFTCIPLYLTSVLKFSLQDAGSVYSVISILRLPGAFMWSTLGNWLLGRRYMTTNRVRKICFGFGQGLAAVFCLGVSFMDDSHKWIAIVLVSLSIMCVTFGTIMTSVIPLDMAPRYAGFITGIAMSVACLTSTTAPLATTAITEQGSFEQWSVVWMCMALVNLSAGLAFLIFGNASLQPWAVQETVYPTVKKNYQSSSDLKLNSDAAALNI